MTNAEKKLEEAVIEMLRQGAKRVKIRTLINRTILDVLEGKIDTKPGSSAYGSDSTVNGVTA